MCMLLPQAVAGSVCAARGPQRDPCVLPHQVEMLSINMHCCANTREDEKGGIEKNFNLPIMKVETLHIACSCPFHYGGQYWPTLAAARCNQPLLPCNCTLCAVHG